MDSENEIERIRQAWEKTLGTADLFEHGDPGLTYKPLPQQTPTLITKTPSAIAPAEGTGVDVTFVAPHQTIAEHQATFVGPAATLLSKGHSGETPKKTVASAVPNPDEWTSITAGAADNGFTMLEKVGEGGMGVVWLAEQGSLRREVAVKKIKGTAGREDDQRFVSEALVTGFLEHPNIVPVHALGQDPDGRLFIAMKLARGESWKKLLHPDDSDPLAPTPELDRHLQILMSVCNAVSFAHSKNIIHRDLKPENVMVGDYGEVLVMDWGIAVEVSETPADISRTIHKNTITGASGTPAYMAPEMTEAEGALLGPWTDVYLLGSILHEILTGRAPHFGKSVREALTSAYRSEPPVFAATVPEELGAICARALARNPAARYSSAAEFHGALEHFLKHRESLLITARAEEESKILAAPGDELRRNYRELYDRHAKVVARYEQALELWDGNAPARGGIRAARLAFAETALALGDIGLAEAQVNRVPADDAAGQSLRQRTKNARAALEAKERSARMARRGLAGAALLIISGLTIAFFWIRSEQRIAEDQRNRAVSEKQRADQNAEQEREQRQRAEGSERIAKQEAARADAEARAANLELAKGLVQQGDVFVTSNRFSEAAPRFWDAWERLDKLKADTFDAETGLFEVHRQRPPPYIVLKGHQGTINGVAITPDGRQILSVSADGSLKLWDAFSGNPIRSLHGHLMASALGLSLDGKRAFTSGAERKMKLWDVASGQLIRTLPTPPQEGHAEYITCLAISPDGLQGLTGSWDKTMKLWDLESGNVIHTLSEDVNNMAFSPDGKQAASAGRDATVKLWDLKSGKAIRTFKGHTVFVTAVVFRPDGKQILSASGDNTLKIWAAEDGTDLHTYTGHTDAVSALAMAPDGLRAASGSFDGSIRLWDLRSGKTIRIFDATRAITSLKFSSDGKSIVAGSDDAIVRVWDAEGGGELRALKGHTGWVPCAAFAPDGRWAASGGNDKLIKLWDAESGRPLGSLTGHTEAIRAIDITPDGTRIFSGSADKTLKLWDVVSGKELRTFSGHTGALASVAVSPDGKRGVSGCWDNTLKLWDLENGNEIRTFTGHTGAVYGVDFSPDGKRIISCSFDSSLKLWDVETGNTIRTFTGHGNSVNGVAFSPDGARVISASWDKTIKLWECNVPPAVPLNPAALQLGAAFEVFSKSKWYASKLLKKEGERFFIHYDGWDDRWDEWVTAERMRAIEPRGEVRTFSGHTAFINNVQFLKDGRRILSGSYDQSLRIWDVEGGREIRALTYHPGSLDCAVASIDGMRILSASRDGTVVIADFSRALKHRAQAARLAQARDDLRRSPKDAAAWQTFGEWYAFQGQHAWAAEAFEKASANGGMTLIPMEISARSFWLAGRKSEALNAYIMAMTQTGKTERGDDATAEQRKLKSVYLQLCLRAVKEEP